MTTRYFGAHISISKGFSYLPKLAQKLNISAIQIHPTAPQRWATKPIDDVKAEELAKNSKDTTLREIYLHAIYLVNLAHSDKQKFHLSKVSIVTYLEFQHHINHYAKLYKVPIVCKGVVVHPGSAKHYPTEKEALERAVKGINWILENSPKDTTILLETSAGAGKIIGDAFEELKILREESNDPSRIKYTLDTQHMYSSGYDIVNNTNTVVEQLENTLGIKNIELIHINDSPYPLGAKKDRHANLGEGTLGTEGIKKFINHPKLKDITVILETPNVKSEETLKKEIEILKSIL